MAIFPRVKTPGQAPSDSVSLLLYQHHDHMNTRVATDQQGNVAYQRGNYPYGDQWYDTGAASPNVARKLTRYRLEPELTASLLNAALYREHSARIGRFLTPDVKAGNRFNPQRMNRYSYASDDPINRWDPHGTNSCPCVDDCDIGGAGDINQGCGPEDAGGGDPTGGGGGDWSVDSGGGYSGGGGGGGGDPTGPPNPVNPPTGPSTCDPVTGMGCSPNPQPCDPSTDPTCGNGCDPSDPNCATTGTQSWCHQNVFVPCMDKAQAKYNQCTVSAMSTCGARLALCSLPCVWGGPTACFLCLTSAAVACNVGQNVCEATLDSETADCLAQEIACWNQAGPQP